MSTSQPSASLDLYSLPLTDLLDTEQVGQLGVFGKRATLQHNRCVGRPGPDYVKVGSRVLYRVSALLAYLDAQQVASAQAYQTRQSRFREGRRSTRAAG